MSTRPDLPEDVAGAAEWYARELGWRIHPLHTIRNGACSCGRPDCPSAGKHPVLPGWQDQATNDPETIRNWWQRWKGANIGLATGDLIAIDLDVKPDEDGRESWRELKIDDDGALINLTPSGGRHIIFTANGHQLGNRGKWRPGVDVRGAGGNLVLPPSRHANGGTYSWDIGHHPEDRDPGEIPAALVDLLTQKPAPKTATFALPARILEGARDDILFRYASSLRARGLDEEAILAALRIANDRCEPPLDDATLQVKAKSAGRYDAGREKPKTADYVDAASDLGYSFRLNVCDDTLECNGEPMTDALRSKIRSQMRDLGLWRVNVAEDAFLASAYDNPHHPVRAYLNGLKWDGTDHIDELAGHVTDEHNIFFFLLPLWLRGAVAKVMTREQNRMLVLDGEQGIGKSYLVRWLASPMPDHFIEAPIDPANKDNLIRLISTWIWEVAELGATTRKADREALKFFISQQTVTVRRSYGHFDLRKPAMASFIGTINNEIGFLTDPTGSRRFMVTTLLSIDWGYEKKIDPNQVWAQAVAEWRDGKPFQLTADQAREIAEINAGYEIEDPIENLLREHYEIDPSHSDWWMATAEILKTLQINGLQGNTRGNQMGLSATMTRLGVERRQFNDRRGYEGVRVKPPAGIPV